MYKIFRLLIICLAGSFIGMPTAAVAGADSGFYIGAGAGAGDTAISEGSFDESDTAYKIFGGYNIGFIPLVDFAVEGSYVDFGAPGNTNSSAEVTGFDAFGLAGLSFGPFGIFAKAGVINWDVDTQVGNTSGSDSGTDPAYGLGARFAIGSFAVRAEYELFDLEGVDIDLITVSGVYTF